MVDESDIRSHLAAGEMPTIVIDTDAVISRSRARRRPRQFAVAAVGVLAAASLVFAGVSTFPRTAVSTSAGVSAVDSDSNSNMDAGASDESAESFLAPDDARVAGRCGALVSSTETTPFGLALAIDISSPVRASGTAFGTVRLTNTSDVAVTGTTASVPDVDLTRDDVSLSHSPDVQILSVIPVNLQPGQSIEFAVSVPVYDCTTIDTGGSLEPGVYAVSTSIAFVPTDPEVGEAAEVRSSPATIVLQ
ncbi:hypothetical protein [Salinibacterium sp. PAMC 21357]|uniref:hypothetical protein n=1 Tax=Salinibacterium sp. PAMC 21357 TaxID=1112215 RepID=UPI00028944B6|nr:hypothetical protein [Salinibacterium sp. PAMC 21357]